MKLSDRQVNEIAAITQTICIGYVKNNPRQSLASFPHEGIDGSSPIPTNDRNDSVKIDHGQIDNDWSNRIDNQVLQKNSRV